MFKKQWIKFNNVYPKLVDVFPVPEPATKHVPEWYRRQPGYYDNNQQVVNGNQQLTVKKCTAFFDSMTSGYMLLCPVDIFIDTTVEPPIFDIPSQLKSLKFPLISSHSTEQVSHYPIKTKDKLSTILRINMAWVISTSSGTSCLFIDPQHKDDSPLTAVSAIIDTDVFYSDGLLSFIVDKNYKGIISKGTPLVQVIPYQRNYWNSYINNDFDPNESLRYQRNKIRTVFSGGYKKYFWHRKEYK